ncbi:MAG: DUF669 domain-containing protein [Gemmataceae bacterium]|nr:DUF669 domain-containing protein [Gemmataceae bacterium]
MATNRKPLADILTAAGGGDDILDRFDTAEAADDFAPVPRGVYVAVAARGGLMVAKTGTRGYEIEFRVIEGEYAGRRLWRRWWLTRDALAYTKRDLAKLGIDSGEKLGRPLPPDRLVCKLTAVVRKDDDGTERNEVKAVEFVRLQTPDADPYAPADGATGGPADGGTGFPFGANAGGAES